jgi:fibro-slime domain-containing protein
MALGGALACSSAEGTGDGQDGDGRSSEGDGTGAAPGSGTSTGSLGSGIGTGQGGSGTEGCDPDDPDCGVLYEPAGPGCGDGEVNADGEECDDGNGLPGDGCNGACEVEPNWDCGSGTCVVSIECGDGVVEGVEVCDDGTSASGDGCSDDCSTIDPFFNCPPGGGACVSTVECGDGRISGAESCEDGDSDGGDGCSASCTLEAGWYCPSVGQACKKVPFCGDKVQSASEECDDGDAESGDGCSSICQVELNYACPTPGSACVPIVVACGDSAITGLETCDDGNAASGDGCSSSCQVETGFSCSVAGARCTPKCGDGLVRGQEACDDGNTANSDGCSSKCTWEKGWSCNATPPHACTADTCGNSKVGNGEACDDGNRIPGDGCAPDCTAEPQCSSYGSAGCTSRCGDGLVIGEECDDGNARSGDGCSSACKVEVGFSCSQPAACAEKLPWDHDNNDGTAGIPTCVQRVPVIYRDFNSDHPHFQPGWDSEGTANLVLSSLDAQGKPDWNSAVTDGVINSGNSARFDDWYRTTTSSTMVLGELVLWDRDRVPTDGTYSAQNNAAGLSFVNRWGSQGEKWSVTVGGSSGSYIYCGNASECPADQTYDKAHCTCSSNWDGGAIERVTKSGCSETAPGFAGCSFDGNNWYTIGGGTAGTLVSYDGNPTFFPLDDKGKTASGDYSNATIAPQYGGNWTPESDYVTGARSHNFHFTSEVRRWFKYDSSKSYRLDFTGDDDVWVFINGKLAVDLGGWHPPKDGSVTISSATAATYNLVNGRVYEIVVFQAERKTTASSYRLTLSGFNANPSVCAATCGDGIVASTEQCDDGVNDGGYGQCQPGCLLGARCGDGTKNGSEQCDNGSNLSGYNDPSAGACAPGCLKPKRCGDSSIDYGYGEVCDLGASNSSAYGGCGTDCQLAPHCGDGIENGSEECDDGVNDGTAGCGPGCVNTSSCGNGYVDPGEQCDDGVNDGGYGECGGSCMLGPRCGDGTLQSTYEQCDDGVNDGGYGECGGSCMLGPRCGDGTLQSTYEQCDDGVNDGGYGQCGASCRLGPYCGDGVKNGSEGCDDGVNEGGYGKCGPTCQVGPYCGDGKVQAPREECDDGNRTNKDGCSSTCLKETVVK